MRQLARSIAAAMTGAACLAGSAGAFAEQPANASGANAAVQRQDTATRAKDVVNADKVIVQGSLCVGLDCVNNESFGFDTLRLKENNTRIKFQDTSTAGFPSNVWQLTANDSASGGANKFSIEDITGSTVPFTLIAGAPNNSLYISALGRLGLRTAVPALPLHARTNNTPALRQEQNSSGGFTAQTWDVAGNEANFFIRDVTGGSRLPLRIRPGAPTNALAIASDGKVGVGTSQPRAPLHVYGTGARFDVSEGSATVAARTLLKLNNAFGGGVGWDLEPVPGPAWQLSGGTEFAVAFGGANPALRLSAGGNLTLAGTLSQGSSRTFKEAIVPLAPERIAAQVADLPLHEWQYRGATDRHVGPMAEDYFAITGLAGAGRAIAPGDIAGLATASMQALAADLEQKRARLAALTERVQRLEALLQSATTVPGGDHVPAR